MHGLLELSQRARQVTLMTAVVTGRQGLGTVDIARIQRGVLYVGTSLHMDQQLLFLSTLVRKEDVVNLNSGNLIGSVHNGNWQSA